MWKDCVVCLMSDRDSVQNELNTSPEEYRENVSVNCRLIFSGIFVLTEMTMLLLKLFFKKNNQ